LLETFGRHRASMPPDAGPSVAPAVLGAATPISGDARDVEETSPGAFGAKNSATLESQSGQASFFGVNFNELWGGGYEEFVEEDLEQIGEAYEAGVLGGVLGVENEDGGVVGIPANLNAPKRDQNKMSAKGLISNFMLSLIGTTTLGLSSQMKAGGWLLPQILVVIGAAIVAENTRLVTATIDKMERETGISVVAYPDFAKGAFGMSGKRVASATSMCALIGFACTFLVLESHNFNFLMPIRWKWLGCENCGHKWWALFLTPVTVIYVFGSPGALLKKTAFLGPVICLFTVVLAWYGGIAAVADTVDIPESCRAGRMTLPSPSELLSFSMLQHITSIASYGFYCFAVIVTIPSLRKQMKDVEKTAPAAIFSYALSMMLFLPIMIFGYAGFGDLVPENLIDGMRHDRPHGWWALNRPFETGTISAAGSALDLVVTLNILLTEAIYIPCAILAIEASFPRVFRHGPRWTGVAMRIAFVVFRFVVATGVESFVVLSQLVASLFCVCNNIVIPVLAFYRIEVQPVGRLRWSVHVVIVVYGLIIMVLGTGSAIVALSPHEVLQPGAQLREGISAQCAAAFQSAQPPS